MKNNNALPSILNSNTHAYPPISHQAASLITNQVNAGSMADIAFLLLIFFLVTTTIDVDKGITVKLPPWTEEEESIDIPQRNVLSVKVNRNNELLVRGEVVPVSRLKDRTIEFILNPNQRTDMPRNPRVAVVSLQNDRETSYETYISVYNELKAAYNNKEAQRAIRKDIPLVISEAEPTDFALK